MRSILPARTSEILITQKCNLNCSYCFEHCKSGRDIDYEKMMEALFKKGIYSSIPSSSFYIFGGEPLMNMELIENLIHDIDSNKEMGGEDKKRYIKSIANNLITNGILIDRYIEIFKKYNMTLQVSLDGPEDVNDACRVDHAGAGHFKKIQENLALCREHDIPYILHGACSRANYSNFTRICEFFLEEALKIPGKDIETLFFRNFMQIVFEDEITDEDIDILLKEFYKTIDMILTTPLLDGFPMKTRKIIAEGFLNRRGGICSAGNTMYSYDDDFNIFPCHRLNTADDKRIENRLGSLVEDVPFNYSYYEQFQEVATRGEMYGAVLDNYHFNKKRSYWLNWCPSTNWEVSGNVFHIPSKYNVLEAELQRYIPLLADHFNLDVDNPMFKKR